MINIVGLNCGLGNQMFIYAFYIKLKKEHKRTFLRNIQAKKHERYGCELGKAFDLKLGTLPIWLDRLLFNKYMLKYIYGAVYDSFQSTDLHPTGNKRLIQFYNGMFQSENYCKGVERDVVQAFTFSRKHFNEYTLALEAEISSKKSVAIHIRRGDYIKLKETFGGICTQDYYRRAIAYMQKHIGNDLTFYVFSDDLEYAKQVFADVNAVFVNGNRGEDSFLDMYLMSICKHNIIANSTFSWWGAWLNQHTDKIVIRPSRFINTKETPFFYPKDWINVD